MKNKIIIIISSLFAIIFILSSCSETTSTNDSPVIVSLSKTVAIVGDNITVTGMRFGTVRNTGYVSFNGIQATEYTNWNDSSIIVKIPAGATSGNVIVYSNSKQSNAVSITILQNYFPSVVGNYWVYESFDLDSLGNKDLSSRIVDSTVISGTQNLFGKNSNIYSTYHNIGGSSEANYYTENGKYYATLANVMPEQMPIPIDFADAWIVIADPDSSTWTIFAQTLNDVEMPLPGGGGTGKLNGKFTIKGEKGVNQTVNTGEGQTISVMAQEYKILYSYAGTITLGGVPIPLQLNFTVTNHQWYGENIGLILDRVDQTTISVSIFYTFTINGSESDLLRYHTN